MSSIEATGPDLLARLLREAERTALRGRNGLKMLTGVGVPPVGTTPYDVVMTAGKAELWRYRSDGRTIRRPILIVHSLISRSYLFDLDPENSFIRCLLDRGFDVYLTNWGVPDELEATNTLETYCDVLLPAMVAATLRSSRADKLTVFGYCMGGILSLLYAAGHPDAPLAGLGCLATPIDFDYAMAPFAKLVRGGQLDPMTLIDRTGNLPADVMFNTFRAVQPTQEITGYALLLHNLWNDDFVRDMRIMMQWTRDQVPFPGACLRQCADLLLTQNLLATGHLPLGGRVADLKDITVPFLNVIGEFDHVVPPAANGDLTSLVGAVEPKELRLSTGHVGLVIGRGAQKKYIPAMAEWFNHRCEVP